MRRLPPLNSLRAFEAAARHLSFTRAADELHVTQGAVSHQVKKLEDILGLDLFRRLPHGLTMTESGQIYFATVREALDRIAAATEALAERERATALTVSMPANFAARWLVHRLGRFVEEHPDIDFRIGASVNDVDFARDGVDMAVRHGTGDWPDLDVSPLLHDRAFAVCSPAYAADHCPGSLQAIASATLLHVQDRSGWNEWLRAAGWTGPAVRHGPVFDQISHAIQAAQQGQGVALARSALAVAELRAGHLVVPYRFALDSADGYWIVGPVHTAKRPKNILFREWLLAEAAADRSWLSRHGL